MRQRSKAEGSLEILGVVDVRHGLAVRARGGRRDSYKPIDDVAGQRIPTGDVTALARQYIDLFGLSALYCADLDAIEHRTPQQAVIRSIASAGMRVWLDAGVASLDDARHALECGASRLIVGSETLSSFEVLESIVRLSGPERVVFSLDLRAGQPIARAFELTRARPEDLAARAAEAGVAALIVLDLARVGSGSGVDLDLLARITSRVSTLPVYAGGGVRDIGDVEQLRQVGCDGVLVATALLDGHITKHDLDRHLACAF